MNDERTLHNLRMPTNAAPHDTGQQTTNRTRFTGIVPRNQQQHRSTNERSLLSLNRPHRNSQPPPNVTQQTDNSISSSNISSRNDTSSSSQLPNFPSIRFRSVENHVSRMNEDIPPFAFADINVRSRGGRGTGPLFSGSNGAGAASPSLSSGTPGSVAGNSNDNNSSRRQSQGQTRSNRMQPMGATGSNGRVGNSTSPSRSTPNGRRNGTSPRRRTNRRNNGTSTSTTGTTTTQSHLHQPRDSHNPFPHPHQRWRQAGNGDGNGRLSDDSDEDIALILMNSSPGLHNMSMEDLATHGGFRGAGTEASPFVLNESEMEEGPASQGSSSAASLLRDEDYALQLQREEWERAETPVSANANRYQFLQAVHQAMGGDGGPEMTHNPPRRGRGRHNLPPMPHNRSRRALQIPVLLDLLPQGLLDAILENGHFPMGMDQLNFEENDYETLLEMEDRMGAVSRGMSQRDINKLPVRKHKQHAGVSTTTAEGAASSSAPSPSSTDTSCAVCLAEFSVGDSKRILPCQHELHKDCIDPWLKTNATCPICRKDIREGT